MTHGLNLAWLVCGCVLVVSSEDGLEVQLHHLLTDVMRTFLKPYIMKLGHTMKHDWKKFPRGVRLMRCKRCDAVSGLTDPVKDDYSFSTYNVITGVDGKNAESDCDKEVLRLVHKT